MSERANKDQKILSLCRKHSRNFRHYGPYEFDELVNVAFIAARTKPSELSTTSSIIWALLRYTKFRTRTESRKSNRATSLQALSDQRGLKKPPQLTPLEVLNLIEQQEALIKSVLKLSSSERTIVYYYFRDNMTFKQLGKRLQCSHTEAFNKLKTIISTLRTELEDFEPRR